MIYLNKFVRNLFLFTDIMKYYSVILERRRINVWLDEVHYVYAELSVL